MPGSSLQYPFNFFRPCIDLYEGKVKQIVGSTLRNNFLLNTHFETEKVKSDKIVENFSSDLPSSYYAELYRKHNLYGGHVIMLRGRNDNALNERSAQLALEAFPQGFHIGGGMDIDNANVWLDRGAEKIIYTSYLFQNQKISEARLKSLKKKIGSSRTVIDLSCVKKNGRYRVAIYGWQQLTSFEIARDQLVFLGDYASEFLVHAIDLEGKSLGIDHELIELLADISPLPIVYAGGIHSLADIEFIVKTNEYSSQPISFTVGSALDIFGGSLDFATVVELGKNS